MCHVLVRSKAATSITIPYIVVHTPDLRSPSPVRVRGCRLVVARLRIGTRPRAPCNGHPSPLPGVAWRSAPLNVQTWANRGSSARWAAARGSLRSSRRALTRWAIGSRARPSSAVHSCSEFRPGHCPKKTRQLSQAVTYTESGDVLANSKERPQIPESLLWQAARFSWSCCPRRLLGRFWRGRGAARALGLRDGRAAGQLQADALLGLRTSRARGCAARSA